MIMKAVVIGAGIAGIACAIRLQIIGYQVTVYENSAYTGGKLAVIQDKNYRFDAGPSLFTMPELIEELFALANKNISEYFDYQQLDPITKYFYEDQSVLIAHKDKNKFAQEIEEKLGEKSEKILDYLKKSAEKYEITADLFLKRSLHKAETYLNKKALKGYWNFRKLDVFRTMHQANAATFSNPKLVQLFDRYATYNGSDPHQTPATLSIIPHLEFNIGAFYPKKGMVAIPQALTKLATDLGVNFVLNSKVDQILIEKKQAKGVLIGENKFFYDLVVSNMDIVNTYQKLMPLQKKPQKILTQPKSTSALIFYWGIKKPFENLDVHNIFFSKDYQTEFQHLFEQRKVSSDPTVYVCISSKVCAEDAPENCENWFVMINVPNNSGQDWDKIITDAREHILAKLSRNLQENIKYLIETESILDPRSIESRTFSSQGALYGNSSNNRYAAFLRHANFSADVKNLYFCGGSVHPGGGIPLCLYSAKIVADLIKNQR